MAIETDADRALFFETDDFAVVATINSTSVNGDFGNEYIEAFDVAGTHPVFTCRTSDLNAITPTVARGTTVTIASVNYTIENIESDGTGITVLILSKD